ncbi:MAG TPA: MBL fold metallo-hydrolase [Fulvivirga sp.]|nr:MBL fold metallo-hydrolase [Fulvivirga sp.]
MLLILLCLFACSTRTEEYSLSKVKVPSLIILGTVQDGGSPHIACKKECCKNLFLHPDKNRKVVSLGIVDPDNNKSYLFEATPDITTQMKMLSTVSGSGSETPDGIFLTHAHIGHYTGLMYLGKEAMNSNRLPVFAMPKMKAFLENNGPWSQLVTNKNIAIRELADQRPVKLNSNFTVIPFLVPHRDEFSETVGYKIIGPNKSAIFIPDIDKWQKWDQDIVIVISNSDYAFIDASFYDSYEINNRDISEIPHPFIIESMSLFADLSPEEKDKIYFIHLNHTNPALNPESEQTKEILEKGFHLAKMGEVFDL